MFSCFVQILEVKGWRNISYVRSVREQILPTLDHPNILVIILLENLQPYGVRIQTEKHPNKIHNKLLCIYFLHPMCFACYHVGFTLFSLRSPIENLNARFYEDMGVAL